jgi:hypothetical protein
VFVYGDLWGAVEDTYCKDEGDAQAMLPASYLEAQGGST